MMTCRVCRIAFLASLLCLTGAPVRAETFQPPRLQGVQVDWDAALRSQPDLPALNAAATAGFPGIADSPLPVLLPLDTEALLRDRAAGEAKPIDHYLSGFRPTGFFLAGPSGYDAAFSFQPADFRFAHPVLVTISGFAFLYDLPMPTGGVERPTRDLARDLADLFPDLRRQILESTLRYSFERHGVPYVVSIQCYDAPHTLRRLSCRNADRVAQRFLRALRLAGGSGIAPPAAPETAPAAARPDQVSSVFTYHPAGSLIPGSGMRGHGGRADTQVYARIRFPLRDAPAYANSQSFMHWGDCDQTGRRPRPRGKDAPYRCRVNSKPLVFNEAAPENYSYPWRDNFCEHRHFYVGQCPAGQGHQGQDIRPANCHLLNDGADRCQAYRHDAVAAREGMVLRETWQESLLLHVNAADARVRLRYLHMNPARMNRDGLLSGRRVREGEVIGQVGNFNRRDNWTTYHLHVEMQVPTRDGWVRVNPYMTLVAAYEHLIRARGVEIAPSDEEPADLSGHAEATSAKADKPRKTKRKPARKSKKKRRSGFRFR